MRKEIDFDEKLNQVLGKRLMNADEIAYFLQVEKSWVYRKVETDLRFPVIRVGRYLRFDLEEVMEYLEKVKKAANMQE